VTGTGITSLRALAGVPDDRLVVLAPSTIAPAADIALLIEAGAQALLDHPDHVLLIFGPVEDPDYHAHCASLVREWSLRHRALKGRLLLRDGLSWGECTPFLGQAALVVCPAAEGEFASTVVTVVAAARAAGIPMLVRAAADESAAARDEEACLSFTGLPDFVRQYRRLFADPVLRRRLADAAREAALHPPATPAG
jgi:glycosyltransferase involved in cell wall biosynthesis